jgi:hypothetical protein
MLTETKTRPETQTFTFVAGVKYRVRKIETFTFTVYRVDGQWLEPSGTRPLDMERAFQRQQLPCVRVSTTHVTLSRNGTRSTLVTSETRGNYADVCEYTENVGERHAVSYRDRSGIRHTIHLSDE